jgi:hypothetical protein
VASFGHYHQNLPCHGAEGVIERAEYTLAEMNVPLSFSVKK